MPPSLSLFLVFFAESDIIFNFDAYVLGQNNGGFSLTECEQNIREARP